MSLLFLWLLRCHNYCHFWGYIHCAFEFLDQKKWWVGDEEEREPGTGGGNIGRRISPILLYWSFCCINVQQDWSVSSFSEISIYDILWFCSQSLYPHSSFACCSCKITFSGGRLFPMVTFTRKSLTNPADMTQSVLCTPFSYTGSWYCFCWNWAISCGKN